MSAAKEAFAHLLSVGLQAVLEEALKTLKSRRGAAGFPYSPTRDEAQQLYLLTRRLPRRGRISLADLDQALQESRFHVTLRAVLEAGYGRFETAEERQSREARSEECWWAELRHSLPDHPAVAAWSIDGMASRSGRWVRRHRKQRVSTAAAVQVVAHGLTDLPVERGAYELLALWSNRLTGDPHTFDSDRPAGQLLLQALADHYGTDDWLPDSGESSGDEEESTLPVSGRERRALLLDRAGLGVDGVSSTVLVAHLAGATIAGAAHSVVAALDAFGGSWALPLREVRTWEAVAAHGQVAWVVENPPVFEALLERLPPETRPTLICTGGFLSAAAVRLLTLLANGGAVIRYSGDFDANGIGIARWVMERFATATPWRMDLEDYTVALGYGGRVLTERGRTLLGRMEGSLAPLALAVLKAGEAAYQEGLIGRLAADLEATFQ